MLLIHYFAHSNYTGLKISLFQKPPYRTWQVLPQQLTTSQSLEILIAILPGIEQSLLGPSSTKQFMPTFQPNSRGLLHLLSNKGALESLLSFRLLVAHY